MINVSFKKYLLAIVFAACGMNGAHSQKIYSTSQQIEAGTVIVGAFVLTGLDYKYHNDTSIPAKLLRLFIGLNRVAYDAAALNCHGNELKTFTLYQWEALGVDAFDSCVRLIKVFMSNVQQPEDPTIVAPEQRRLKVDYQKLKEKLETIRYMLLPSIEWMSALLIAAYGDHGSGEYKAMRCMAQSALLFSRLAQAAFDQDWNSTLGVAYALALSAYCLQVIVDFFGKGSSFNKEIQENEQAVAEGQKRSKQEQIKFEQECRQLFEQRERFLNSKEQLLRDEEQRLQKESHVLNEKEQNLKPFFELAKDVVKSNPRLQVLVLRETEKMGRPDLFEQLMKDDRRPAPAPPRQPQASPLDEVE